MNEDKLIQELVSKYGLKLKEHDPIFAGLFLNKIVLQEYLSEFEGHLAESITNVAIKEDVTVRKLKKVFDDAQARTRQDLDRTLNQFGDDLQGRLHALLNQQNIVNHSSPWLWFIVFLLVGLLTGLLIGKFKL